MADDQGAARKTNYSVLLKKSTVRLMYVFDADRERLVRNSSKSWLAFPTLTNSALRPALTYASRIRSERNVGACAGKLIQFAQIALRSLLMAISATPE
jgi:hypothetical protein